MLMHNRRIAGFTLMEIMVVVAIVGILAAVALPSYQNSVRKGKRQVAISDLLLYQQAQERYRSNHLTYAADLTTLTNEVPVNKVSPPTDYTFAVSGASATAYTITATPQGNQAQGPEVAACPTLWVTSNNTRGPNVRVCWAR